MSTFSIGWRVLVILCTGSIAFAQEAAQNEAVPDELAAEIAAVQALLDGLSPQQGDITLGDGLLAMNVPETFNYYPPKDAAAILVDLWGNPPDVAENMLGMLMPAQYSPVDDASWAVTMEYIEDGYVSDEDAASIDYDELLRDMQSATSERNDALREAGYSGAELVGWAEAPRYDATTHKLYWAKELMFDGADASTLNYDIRALGRRGILSMTFIASTSQLEEINALRDSVLAMAEFTPGNRYTDFDPDLDKVAAYGIGALIGGKLAAKAGLFGAALLLLKKFWFVILIGIAALGRFVGRLFGRKSEETETPPSTG